MKVPKLLILSLTIYSLIFGSILRAESEPSKQERPNIVFILSDDLGYGSVGCYGATVVNTPNIDRIAVEGRKFTDANTSSSVCTPSRYSILTGRYCWRTILKHDTLPFDAPLLIDTDRLTVASLLKRLSYRTAAIGKWHLGFGTGTADYQKELKPGPLELGFDYYFGVPDNHGGPVAAYVENHSVLGLKPGPLLNDKPNCYYGRPIVGLNAPMRVDAEDMHVLTDKAVSWLQEQEEGKPFFLYFATTAIHEPVTPSKEVIGTSKAGIYGDYIHDLDQTVGRVLKVLDEKHMTNNTLLIFSSDNGGDIDNPHTMVANDAQKLGLEVNGPWRGGKHSQYQGGFRVPFIIRWPGKIPANSVCDETTCLVDILASFAALFNVPLTANDAPDSCNLLPAWLGQKVDHPLRKDMILHSASGAFTFREGPWKYIEETNGTMHKKPVHTEAELFNLTNDPAEKNNVISEHPDLAQKFSQLLEKYRQEGKSVSR
jgi:arylsulfatase A